jgi:branched-chain amino acid transport system ATP-binding protein
MDFLVTMNLLETSALSKSFGGLQAVRNVNFSIRTGEVRAIIGPNGAGKTTFVSLLSGRIMPTSGNVHFQNRDITTLPSWRRVQQGIAYTFQITSIYPTLSVYENVAIAAQVQSTRIKDREDEGITTIDEIVDHCLTEVGLSRYLEVKAGELSYGHQRLLEISMGLAVKPLLLILDEPTQGLSDSEIEEFSRLVEVMRLETTLLIIEHNMAVVMSLADRITVLDQGTELATGTPEQILSNDEVQEAYLGGLPEVPPEKKSGEDDV